MKVLKAPQSGSLAGTTASHNRYGQYERNRRTPVSPTRTSRQSTVRGLFSAASSAWQTLTAGVQAAWSSFAASHPITDRLGSAITLDGHAYFVGVYTSLLNCGVSGVPSIPSNTTIVPVSPCAVYASDDGIILLTWAPGTAGDFVNGAASKLVSNGVTFNKTFTQFATSDAAVGIMDISADYVATWGIPDTGRQIFGRLTPVNSSGIKGTPVIVRQRVVAGGSVPLPVLAASVAGQAAVSWSGGASMAIAIYQDLGGTGTFTPISVTPSVATGALVDTPGAGNDYKVRLFDGIDWSNFSNVEAGS